MVVFHLRANLSTSFAPSVARSLRGLDLMPMRFGVELVCKLVVLFAGRTKTIFDLRRVVDVVADRCMMEDRVDRCSC